MHMGNSSFPDKGVNNNDNRLACLRSLNTAKLQAMLQQESFFGSDDRLDVDLIQHILEILDEREPIVEEPDAELSYKVFKEEIIPQLKKEKAEANPASLTQVSAAPRRGSVRRRIAVVLIAAIVSLLLGGTLVASAFGQNIWSSFIRWGKDTFQIGPEVQITSGPSTDPSPEISAESTISLLEPEEYQSLDEAIEAMGPEVLALKWIPDGFELKRAMVTKGRQVESLTALYKAGDSVLIYDVSFYFTGNASFSYEIDENSVEPINISGNTCYIVSNLDKKGIIWIDKEVVYNIFGNVDRDTLIKMVESIYEGDA